MRMYALQNNASLRCARVYERVFLYRRSYLRTTRHAPNHYTLAFTSHLLIWKRDETETKPSQKLHPTLEQKGKIEEIYARIGLNQGYG